MSFHHHVYTEHPTGNKIWQSYVDHNKKIMSLSTLGMEVLYVILMFE